MLNPDRKYSLCITPEDYEPGAPPCRMTLTELADFYKTDKGTIKHNYTPVYSKLMWYARNLPIDMLEIGVACGASLKMWSAFFPEGHITGLDVRPECKAMCKDYPRIVIDIADACTYDPGKSFDFIIDDGSHVSADVVKTFENLWKHVKPGGLYFIEDLRCTHNPDYPKLYGIPRPPYDFSRRHITLWLDNILKRMDNRQGDIEFVQMHKELMVLGKKA